MGWKGESEPGKQSDLIVLLSQDRWIRLTGAVDDVKAVTSGQWLRESTLAESALVAFATLLVYFDVVLAANASQQGKVLLIMLLFSSAGLLGLVNECTQVFRMYGRTIKPEEPPEPYSRRLELAKKLIKQTGRSDWAIRLGMAQPSDVDRFKDEDELRKGSPDRHEKRLENGDSSAIQADGQVTL